MLFIFILFEIILYPMLIDIWRKKNIIMIEEEFEYKDKIEVENDIIITYDNSSKDN